MCVVRAGGHQKRFGCCYQHRRAVAIRTLLSSLSLSLSLSLLSLLCVRTVLLLLLEKSGEITRRSGLPVHTFGRREGNQKRRPWQLYENAAVMVVVMMRCALKIGILHDAIFFQDKQRRFRQRGREREREKERERGERGEWFISAPTETF